MIGVFGCVVLWLFLLIISGFFVYLSFGPYYMCRVGEILSRNCFSSNSVFYEIDVYRELLDYNGDITVPNYGLIECKNVLSCNSSCYGSDNLTGVNWCVDSEVIPVAYVYTHPTLSYPYLLVSILAFIIFVVTLVIAVRKYQNRDNNTVDEETPILEEL